MLKKLLITVLVVSMLFVLGACGSTPAETPSETPAESPTEGKVGEIKSAGKIVLGTAADYPPYEFHKLIDGKDEIVGFDIEIAKLIAKDLGVELEIVDMKFDGLLPALVTDDIDFVIAGMVANEERSKTVDFSMPYYAARQRMVVRAEDKDIYKEPADLAGKSVGAQKTTIQEEIAFEQFAESQYVGLSKITDLVLELQNKKIDAVILAEPVAKAYVAQNSALHLPEIDLGAEDGVAIAVNKGNTDLVEEFNKILEGYLTDGTIENLIVEATKLSEED